MVIYRPDPQLKDYWDVFLVCDRKLFPPGISSKKDWPICQSIIA